jgi:septal ring factor EnvC (AmiA/AmiB activator)
MHKAILQLLTDNLHLLPLVLICVLLSSYTTSLFKQDQIDIYIEEFNQFKEQAEKTQQFADSLASLVEEYKEEIEELNDSILVQTSELTRTSIVVATLSARTEELRDQLDDSIMEEVPEQVVVYIDGLEEENVALTENVSAANQLIATLQTQSDLFQNSLTLETTRADSLAIIVAAIPEPPSNPNRVFGFIPKPSRTQTFILGTLVGGVATWKLIG